MKKYSVLFYIGFLFLGLNSLQAQLKIGYVDSEAVMDSLSEAQDAQSRLDAQIQEWQDELKGMENEWQEAYNDYENRKLILSDKKRAEFEKELFDKETKISQYRQQKFGVNGELFKKQDELMKPIQNKIFNVIKEVAEEEDLDFVFDRSGDMIFLYAKDEYDITKLVIEKLK